MRGYLALTAARFRVLLQYRAAAIAGIVTQLFWGLIRMMIFDAFYRSSHAAQPLSRADTITYIWLGQALLGFLPWSAESDIRTMIRTGTVAYELVRPLDLYTLWYSRALANRVAPTLLRAVPLFVVAGLFLGLHAPPSLASGAGWALCTGGAVLLGSAFGTLITISLLWTVSGEGIARFVPSFVYVLSGMLVPLPLLPAWSQPILNALPFRDLVDAPFRVYLGHIPPSQVALVLAHQLAWTVAIVALGRFLMAHATRRLVVQGG